MLKRVCSYCNVTLGPADSREELEERISHGICRECLGGLMEGEGEPLSEYLDSLEIPIFVVDADGCVLLANTLAGKLVSKKESEIEGRLGGEVFECTYAKQPGGCGKTLHCRTCVIRNTVTHTRETGESCIRVPATQDLDSMAGIQRIRFLISTERVGDTVFLRIDEVQAYEAAPM